MKVLPYLWAAMAVLLGWGALYNSDAAFMFVGWLALSAVVWLIVQGVRHASASHRH